MDEVDFLSGINGSLIGETHLVISGANHEKL